MTGGKTDLEQLKGILAQFDIGTIKEAVGKLFESTILRKSIKDFTDPGPEVKVGTDSRVNLSDMAKMERIIEGPNFLPVHYLEEGAIVQRAVARVTLVGSGSGYGTGFLVSQSLFMTNNHVIPNEAFADNVEMQFNYQLDYKGNPQTVDVYSPNPEDVFYTNSDLDFTLIRLNPHYSIGVGNPWATAYTGLPLGGFGEAMLEYTPRPGGSPQPKPPIQPPDVPPVKPPFGLHPKLTKLPYKAFPLHVANYAGDNWGYLQIPNNCTYATDQHVNIIQHPAGRRKEVALQKNNISNIYNKRIRYTTDTEPGSSGSPVFNNEWDLIAIHHAAGEWDNVNNVWVSNEGMRMDKIADDLRNNYAGTTTGDQILAELGL